MLPAITHPGFICVLTRALQQCKYSVSWRLIVKLVPGTKKKKKKKSKKAYTSAGVSRACDDAYLGVSAYVLR